MNCPWCGSTEYSMASSDASTNFRCLDCGSFFAVIDGKVYSENDLIKLQESQNEQGR